MALERTTTGEEEDQAMSAFTESVVEAAAHAWLHPERPTEALDDAFRKLTQPAGAKGIRPDRAFMPVRQEDWT